MRSRALRAQTYPHWECIVVDDGSSDETATVAERFCADDPTVPAPDSQSNAGGIGCAQCGARALQRAR